jgi:DNA polymerase-4
LTRRTTLPDATDDAAVIRSTAIRLWDQERVLAPIRLLGVAVSGIGQRGQRQLSLFVQPEARPKLGATMDAIHERFGGNSIRRGAEPPEKVTPSLRWKRGE